jgi:hypothetical protein
MPAAQIPDGHTPPQIPQLSGSVWVLAHSFPQSVCPTVHGAAPAQIPAVQMPDGHPRPQPPQLSGSSPSIVQVPLQSVHPA